MSSEVSESVRLSALGRDVEVGDFYNYFNDEIFKSNIQVSGKRSEPISKVTRSFFFQQPDEFKGRMLGINSHFDENKEHGYVDPNDLWFAKYLQSPSTKDVAEVAVFFRVDRRIETLEKSFIDSNMTEYQLRSHGRATHLVEQVIYGTEIICSMSRYIDKSKSETKESVERNIYWEVKKYFDEAIGPTDSTDCNLPMGLKNVFCTIFSSHEVGINLQGTFLLASAWIKNIINIQTDNFLERWRPIEIALRIIPYEIKARILSDRNKDVEIEKKRNESILRWIEKESHDMADHFSSILGRVPPLNKTLHQFIGLLIPLRKEIEKVYSMLMTKKVNPEQVLNKISPLSELLENMTEWVIDRRREFNMVSSFLKGTELKMIDLEDLKALDPKCAKVFILTVDEIPDQLMERLQKLVNNTEQVAKRPVFKITSALKKIFNKFADEATLKPHRDTIYHIGLVPVITSSWIDGDVTIIENSPQLTEQVENEQPVKLDKDSPLFDSNLASGELENEIMQSIVENIEKGDSVESKDPQLQQSTQNDCVIQVEEPPTVPSESAEIIPNENVKNQKKITTDPSEKMDQVNGQAIGQMDSKSESYGNEGAMPVDTQHNPISGKDLSTELKLPEKQDAPLGNKQRPSIADRIRDEKHLCKSSDGDKEDLQSCNTSTAVENGDQDQLHQMEKKDCGEQVDTSSTIGRLPNTTPNEDASKKERDLVKETDKITEQPKVKEDPDMEGAVGIPLSEMERQETAVEQPWERNTKKLNSDHISKTRILPDKNRADESMSCEIGKNCSLPESPRYEDSQSISIKQNKEKETGNYDKFTKQDMIPMPKCPSNLRIAEFFARKDSGLSQQVTSKGQPKIYLLNAEEKFHGADFRTIDVGKPNKSKNRKIVILMGATGCGKSTLINGMVNYILGVKWDDPFRFKCVREDQSESRNQAHSQTSSVTAYTIHHQKGMAVDYSITLIDTPGYGDTRGVARDKEITKMIHRFLCQEETRVEEIHAACFVAASGDSRLTATQSYIIDSVLSIFGKDVKNNIRLLVTFADNADPPVVEACRAANFPSTSGEITYSKFNSSVLYAPNNQQGEDEFSFDQLFWDMGQENFEKFFKMLNTMKGKDLASTRAVIQRRQLLEQTFRNIEKELEECLVKIEDIDIKRRRLWEYNRKMETNQNFETETTEKQMEKVKCDDGLEALNCFNCKRTCYGPFSKKKKPKNIKCKSLLCTGCQDSHHVFQNFEWRPSFVKTKMTQLDMKFEYESSRDAKMSTQQLIDKYTDDLNMAKGKVFSLLDQVGQTFRSLESDALRSNALSPADYLSLMRSRVAEEQKPGYLTRLETLQELQRSYNPTVHSTVYYNSASLRGGASGRGSHDQGNSFNTTAGSRWPPPSPPHGNRNMVSFPKGELSSVLEDMCNFL